MQSVQVNAHVYICTNTPRQKKKKKSHDNDYYEVCNVILRVSQTSTTYARLVIVLCHSIVNLLSVCSTHTLKCSYIHTNTYTFSHTHMLIHTLLHSHTHTHMRTHTHTHTYACICAYTHTYTHIHTLTLKDHKVSNQTSTRS